MNTLLILDSSGETELTWNPEDATETAQVRQTVEDLRRQGYSFFLVDGSPADEVAAGRGTLVVKRIEAEALLTPEAPEPVAETQPGGKGKKAVAVRQMRGG